MEFENPEISLRFTGGLQNQKMPAEVAKEGGRTLKDRAEYSVRADLMVLPTDAGEG